MHLKVLCLFCMSLIICSKMELKWREKGTQKILVKGHFFFQKNRV